MEPVTVTVRIVLDPPKDASSAELEEVQHAIADAVSDIGDFDVDAAESPDGVECWTVSEAYVVE
jgi:hypothetical protein